VARRRPDARWGAAQRAHFDLARKNAGHTQQQCADHLADEYGAARVSQVQIHRWITGATRTPECVDELLRYSERYAPASEFNDPEIEDDGEAPPSLEASEDIGSSAVNALRSEIKRLEAESREERSRAVRLARDVERLGRELARAMGEAS